MRFDLLMMMFMASCVAVAGCQHEPGYGLGDDAPPVAEAPEDPVARQDVYNYAALDTFPLQVRMAFQREYPDVAITTAQMLPAESGPLLYRIVFIQKGQPQSVMYDRAGSVVSPPANLPAEPVSGEQAIPAAERIAPAPAP